MLPRVCHHTQPDTYRPYALRHPSECMRCTRVCPICGSAADRRLPTMRDHNRSLVRAFVFAHTYENTLVRTPVLTNVGVYNVWLISRLMLVAHFFVWVHVF